MTDLAAPAEAAFADAVAYRPPPVLDGLVDGIGYEQRGFPPGEHQGLPSRHVTFVIPFEAPLELSVGPDGRPGRHALDTCVGGLHTTPVTIHHDGTQVGIQLALTPAGARVLFGVPAGELAGTVVDVEELWGALAVELVDRVRAAPTWAERLAVLDDVLGRIAAAGRDDAAPRPEVAEAWRLLTSRRETPVAAVAREVGWSRRHLSQRFAAEYGGRSGAARPDRAVRAAVARLKAPRRPSLATVAAECGYADQAHMAPTARDLAGRSPSEWLAAEVLPLVADGRESPSPDRPVPSFPAAGNGYPGSGLERRRGGVEVEVAVEVDVSLKRRTIQRSPSDDEVGDRGVVGAEEGERLAAFDGLGHDLGRSRRRGRPPTTRWSGWAATMRSTPPRTRWREGVGRLGAGDHVPALLGDHLHARSDGPRPSAGGTARPPTRRGGPRAGRARRSASMAEPGGQRRRRLVRSAAAS